MAEEDRIHSVPDRDPGAGEEHIGNLSAERTLYTVIMSGLVAGGSRTGLRAETAGPLVREIMAELFQRKWAWAVRELIESTSPHREPPTDRGRRAWPPVFLDNADGPRYAFDPEESFFVDMGKRSLEDSRLGTELVTGEVVDLLNAGEEMARRIEAALHAMYPEGLPDDPDDNRPWLLDRVARILTGPPRTETED